MSILKKGKTKVEFQIEDPTTLYLTTYAYNGGELRVEDKQKTKTKLKTPVDFAYLDKRYSLKAIKQDGSSLFCIPLDKIKGATFPFFERRAGEPTSKRIMVGNRMDMEAYAKENGYGTVKSILSLYVFFQNEIATLELDGVAYARFVRLCEGGEPDFFRIAGFSTEEKDGKILTDARNKEPYSFPVFEVSSGQVEKILENSLVAQLVDYLQERRAYSSSVKKEDKEE